MFNVCALLVFCVIQLLLCQCVSTVLTNMKNSSVMLQLHRKGALFSYFLQAETSAQLLNAADVCEESSSQILIIIFSLLTTFILTLVLHPCLDL